MSDFDRKVELFFKNYQDRGMKKWAGFFLSDHTLKINKDQSKQKIVHHKKETMPLVEIGDLLFKAFSEHRYVEIQLKELDGEGEFKDCLSGFVEGYYGSMIMVSGQKIDLNNINHISLSQNNLHS